MQPVEVEKPRAMTPVIKWNPQVKCIISDVDETIADNFTPAEPEMITELSSVLSEGIALVPVSGASLKRMRKRFIDELDPKLRQKIVVAHCSGAEVWGFNPDGTQMDRPFFSVYDSILNDEQKKLWREQVQKLIKEFHLTVYEPAPFKEFKEKAGDDPHAVILEDRGPQITFELINSYDLTKEQADAMEHEIPNTHGNFDLRIPLLERADVLFQEAGIPITPRLGGVWAVDFAPKGVNKTTAVQYIFNSPDILKRIGVDSDIVNHPEYLEIWGDKFSVHGGTDRHMCEAVDPNVRAIDFRKELKDVLPPEFNIVLWDGIHHEHHGLLEYLKSRHAN